MYAHQMDVPQSIEMYDKVHAELVKTIGKPLPDGCLLHMITRTETGFRVTEVWDSHDTADKFGDDVLRPIIERIAGPEAVAGGPPPSQELDLHTLELGQQANAPM
jgi:hypothetical protein